MWWCRDFAHLDESPARILFLIVGFACIHINSEGIFEYEWVVIRGTIRKLARGWWVVKFVPKVSQVMGEEEASGKEKK